MRRTEGFCRLRPARFARVSASPANESQPVEETGSTRANRGLRLSVREGLPVSWGAARRPQKKTQISIHASGIFAGYPTRKQDAVSIRIAGELPPALPRNRK